MTADSQSRTDVRATANVRAPADARTPTEVRTAILTVDDDPGVSRAVARDLRRRYGKDYRIVRAESGRDALDALQGAEATRR